MKSRDKDKLQLLMFKHFDQYLPVELKKHMNSTQMRGFLEVALDFFATDEAQLILLTKDLKKTNADDPDFISELKKI